MSVTVYLKDLLMTQACVCLVYNLVGNLYLETQVYKLELLCNHKTRKTNLRIFRKLSGLNKTTSLSGSARWFQTFQWHTAWMQIIEWDSLQDDHIFVSCLKYCQFKKSTTCQLLAWQIPIQIKTAVIQKFLKIKCQLLWDEAGINTRHLFNCIDYILSAIFDCFDRHRLLRQCAPCSQAGILISLRNSCKNILEFE